MTGRVGKAVLKIIPVEPLHLGVRNLGGVDVFSADEVWPLPLPSTVLGALGYASGKTIGVDCDRLRSSYDFGDLKALARELFNREDVGVGHYSERPVLWGPLVRVGGADHIAVGLGLLELLKVGEYVRNAEAGRGEIALRDALGVEARVGVQLDKSLKTARRLFRAKYVGYKEQLEIRYLLDGFAAELKERVVRIGGEGRVARVELDQKEEVDQGAGDYAVALQPVLIYSDSGIADIGQIKGLECVEEIYGVYDGERFRVRVVNLGLGFSEVCRFRRPMLKALPPGTVVKLKKDCGDARAIGLLAELGYGSIYRADASKPT